MGGPGTGTARSIQSMATPTKKILTFLVLTFGLSTPLYCLIATAESIHSYSAWLMWTPGIAALLTQLLFTRSVAGLGWRIGKPKYLLMGYLLPFVYVSLVYALVWVSGIGPLDVAGFAKTMGTQAPFTPPSSAQQAAAAALYFATWGVLTTAWATLGEELGWRGLLVPELARRFSFTATALLSGVAWAAWHVPVMVLADYHNPGAPPWYGLVCFSVLVIGISFAFAWLRLQSGSVWVTVLLHASHNIAIQAIFTPLTGTTAFAPYVIDEFGLGLALAGVLVGRLFWRKRAALPPAAALQP
jgi:membrane protease YdiL (CAAX protease family)